MIEDIEKRLDQYWAWLKDKTQLHSVDDAVEITTPYLDRHNDYLQIYAKHENGGYVLSDDGYTLDDLALSGCSLDSPKKQALLNMTLNGFGIHLNGETKALEIKASKDNFALRKHSIIQAMLAVNDLFYTASPTIASLFHEDVVSWLDISEIRYTPSVKFTGKTGFDHRFDFVIPKSRVQPERIVRAINRPNRETAQGMVLAWIDTKENRPPETHAYTILNDTERAVPENVLDAMRSYDIQPIQWSEREAMRESLAA